MKKYIMATLVALSMMGAASAAEISFEGQKQNGVEGAKDAVNYQLMVKQDFTKNFAGDVSVLQNLEDTTNALTTRLEAGATGQFPVTSGVSAYVRGAVGEKYTNTTNWSYYSVEPGVVADIPSTNAKVSLGWRFRDAFRDSTAINDTTRTWRAKLGYDLTKQDNIYIGYDYMRGDQKADIYRVGYARSF